MKSLFRIIRRYSISAGGIILLILGCNIGIFMYILYQSAQEEDNTGNYTRTAMENIGQEMYQTDAGYYLSEKGKKLLKETPYVWALAMDAEGKVVWEWKVPENIPREFTLFNVASFSRWYLNDYPVRVWHVKDVLMVFAYSPEDMVIYSMPMALKQITDLPVNIKRFAIANFFAIIIVILLFAYRFYASLRPISEGIENLSLKKPIALKEKGTVRELAQKINQTSRLLQKQEEQLSKRDQARADWISGVSHDIRTPLTLIMGYAEKLMEKESLHPQEREMAETIQRQSYLIKQLIEDLNLTSKLSGNTVPLHLKECSPAQILRECVTEIYNNGLEPEFSIEVYIADDVEQIKSMADESLLKRALRNILGNSIRHNPQGCLVNARLSLYKNELYFLVQDDGKGIPQQIVDCLKADETALKDEEKSIPHIMGMRITEQVVALHGGTVNFYPRDNGNYDYGFLLPVKPIKKCRKNAEES